MKLTKHIRQYHKTIASQSFYQTSKYINVNVNFNAKIKTSADVNININLNLNVKKNTKIDLSNLVFFSFTIFTMLAGEIEKLLTNSSHIPRILLMGFKGRRGLLADQYT